MKLINKGFAGASAWVLAAATQAHEGHTAMGTIAHDIQHAGWLAAALVSGSVLILVAFGKSAMLADRYLADKKRRR